MLCTIRFCLSSLFPVESPLKSVIRKKRLFISVRSWDSSVEWSEYMMRRFIDFKFDISFSICWIMYCLHANTDTLSTFSLVFVDYSRIILSNLDISFIHITSKYIAPLYTPKLDILPGVGLSNFLVISLYFSSHPRYTANHDIPPTTIYRQPRYTAEICHVRNMAVYRGLTVPGLIFRVK